MDANMRKAIALQGLVREIQRATRVRESRNEAEDKIRNLMDEYEFDSYLVSRLWEIHQLMFDWGR